MNADCPIRGPYSLLVTPWRRKDEGQTPFLPFELELDEQGGLNFRFRLRLEPGPGFVADLK